LIKNFRIFFDNRGDNQSATVCLNLCLDGVALDADKLGVLTAVDAERVTPSHSGEEEEAEAPEDGNATDSFPWNLSGFFAAGGAWGSTATIVVVSGEVDDHGPLLLGRRSVHGLRSHHHGLRLHHHRLAVHYLFNLC
jgi:hypothetical protein